MSHGVWQIIIRIILGLGATFLIIDFSALLLLGASRSIGAVIGIFPCILLLGYAVFMPRINDRIVAIWKGGGAGRLGILILAVLFVCGVILFTIESVLMCVYSNKKAPDSERPPVVIVLGCQVRDGHPSTLLQARIDTAYDYLIEHPDCYCILSGGQGTDEVISEAQCMRDVLVSRGIAPERLYVEDKSTTTRENLKFSKEIMERENLGDTAVIVTNAWHEFRAQVIAHDLGLPCGGVGAPTAWWLLPANYLRELLAIVYQFVF